MLYALGDIAPQFIGSEHYVAPNATLIGNVRLLHQATVWFNTVIRGDNDLITIGEGTNVQDDCVLHTDNGIPLTLGRRVSIGHQVMLHGCEVGEGTLIGIQSTVLNRAKIGKYCLIGAKALVGEGKVIPDRSVVFGSPGKVVREVTDEEVKFFDLIAQSYIDNGARYRASLRPIL